MMRKQSSEAGVSGSLLSGILGVSVIALDDKLRIAFATPDAISLCGLQKTGAEWSPLPATLLRALRSAMDKNCPVFFWQAAVANQARTYEIHLARMSAAQGQGEGYSLLMVDASARLAAEAQLQQHNEVLKALVSVDWMLSTSVQWQTALPEAMACIGAVAGFTRIQVFQKLMNGSRTARLTCLHQWLAPGCEVGEPTAADGFPNEARWIQSIRQGEPVFGAREDFPQAEQAMLQRRQTRAMALLPVFSGGEWWGMISFEHDRDGDSITQEQLDPLVSVARSLGAAVQRQITGERLEQARLAFDSTAEGIMICDDKKRITAVNKGFTTITGYGENEAVGRTPEILSSGRNPPELYAAMWQDIVNTGGWRGEIWNRRKDGEIYPQWLTITAVRNPEGRATHYVAVFADISEAKESQQRLHQLVNHDPLTGLPNRRLLNELLGRAVKHSDRQRQNIGLLFIDLDRFKSVNDTLGHHAGDLLLSIVTHRLTAVVRECDVVARLSGDEFIIMMDSLNQPEDAAVVAQKVISALQESFVINGKEVFIGASVGISIYPQDGQTANDLIRAADIAMYQAKREGRNDFRFYTPGLGETVHERLTLDTLLRHALERNELVVHYQPQIALDTGEIVGVEALVRWQHPEQGMIPPGKFIPLAEETGLIIPIGEWVLRTATSDLLRLEEAGCALQRVSVNVSAMQIHRSQFSSTVYGVLVETGCDPERLELEITESAIMNSVEYVAEVCRKLKDMGVGLALDDFGTGYSSLSYLKRFPLDKLKIDQSFVRDLPHDADDMAISSAIIGLGHNLGLTVIAEGVENVEQERFLRGKGCEEVQGYLYSRPIPFATLLELIATRTLRAP